MNEEEKKAIEILKQEPDYSLSYYKRERAIDIVLNLIDKQQEEIEKHEENELILCMDIEKQKEKVKQQQKEIKELKVINNMQKYRIEVIDERELISKDKIKEKIKEIENSGLQENIKACVCNKLAQLLEE